MSDAIVDESVPHRRNPFDASTSDRNPFPSFDGALANAPSVDDTEEGENDNRGEQDVDCALNWSIDTLAELQPVAFSPLGLQRQSVNRLETSLGSSGFFDDEKQYAVLRTPVVGARASRHTVAGRQRKKEPETMRNRIPSPLLPAELSQCCSETVRVQDRLQQVETVVVPSPLPHWESRRLSPSPTSTRRPERHEVSVAGVFKSESASPFGGPPRWSASPAAMRCGTPVGSTHLEGIFPSPLTSTLVTATPKQRSRLRLSFGLSPITFSVAEERCHENETAGSEETGERCRPNSGALSEEKTLPLSCTER
ncbi:unnamed protein product [Hyaloperonospora brassicae]|uniref:Uncharacterized protein n=1 Tax=Hyaloperonospora brassicae TaxID=162125 RepID=A0AAV0TDW7_HYABA|nr:unnamed protein product [Hyaloperonospora brassicae]